jgi:hypothetical protein
MDLGEAAKPLPPEPGDEIMRMVSLDGRQTTLLVRVNDFTYRYAGIVLNDSNDA